jgi:hypothetical protein
MKRTIAGFAAGAFAIVAVATAPQAAATPEEDFLSALARSGFSYPASVAPQVIQSGQSVCSGWASGTSYADAVATMAKITGGSANIATVFVRAATTPLCPKYASQLR